MPKRIGSWLTAAILLISSANGFTGHSPTVNKQGDHSSHTTDELGNFVHPFLGASPEVRNIHYPDSRTFSVRLEKKPGPFSVWQSVAWVVFPLSPILMYF